MSTAKMSSSAVYPIPIGFKPSPAFLDSTGTHREQQLSQLSRLGCPSACSRLRRHPAGLVMHTPLTSQQTIQIRAMFLMFIVLISLEVWKGGEVE